MIVSFHPIIEAHANIICAGRQPDADDLAAIQKADAVILPQGCPEALYRMARVNCPHVFPNVDIRFDHPGKLGQIDLFRSQKVPHPETRTYASLAAYRKTPPPFPYPWVIKLDWGGQGDTIFKADTPDEMAPILNKIESCETTGQKGFLIQKYIAGAHRSLRVAVIGTQFISYWRLQSQDTTFGTSVAHGAVIDADADPHLQSAAVDAAQTFCARTGLQLAGLDYIFNEPEETPIILEVNYYFGRTGIGGSDKYYKTLEAEVDKWLSTFSLSRRG